ncbi:hypothetical protein HYH03_000443 [Edaphochlamys debaryana]|uniref:Conserved oligomeric Golgi complex subunit 2 n=1 Tax=Edaphochlamys debaryana TaxID=47281 RepID=A0A835YFN6_9CHLO|nr:hypothetical protein HYH03_000443 [Edaphochlamys debaryana]|eukprot:KAG2501945.1 hypothetical protein HYH03_000443 [Edaphochlamys debaryana]
MTSNSGTDNGVGAAADSATLLGRAACPVWLNPERFLEDSFNADACVADLRRYVPLATLQNELSGYLGTLKTKLVEVINEDYADYVGLSGRLANVEGAVVRMRKPLLDLRDKLHAVQDAVRTELNSLNQGLRKRKEVATQRALLELILEVSHVAAKVDKLLEEVAAADQGGDGGAGAGAGDLVSQCRLLERVAAEVSRLTFLANKGKELAFVRSLEPRIASHRAALRGRLSAALSAALGALPGSQGGGPLKRGPTNTAAALHALHAAADLGEAEAAEAAVRSVVVAPLVDKLISDHKALGHSASAPGGGGLAALLSNILAGVRAELGPLLDASLAPGSALRSLDLLSGAVLDEVQGAIAAALPGVFSPGVPPAFHANYLATMAWLRQLEAMAATRGAVERLRGSPGHTALMRRWNVSVYFSLLYQEIAGELEDALSSDRLEPASATASAGGDALSAAAPAQLAPSLVLLRCLRRAASPDVVLPPLTDRFLRLALQLTQRYAAWVAAAAAARRDAAAHPPQPPQPPQQAAGGDGAGAAPPAPGPSGPAAWAGTIPAEELAAVVHDAEAVYAAIVGPYTSSFLELLPPQPTPAPGEGDGNGAAADGAAGGVSSVVISALAEAAGAVRAAGRSLAAALTDEVVERCVTVVRQLKGITATYRMTAKGPPTRASHYVSGVLTPLRQLLDGAKVKKLAPALQQELLVLPVADGLCSRYAALADELLQSVRKTESSLKRLKKAKGGAGEEDAATAVSDSDKITLQLHLDVEELGAQLARLLAPRPGAAEGDAASLASFQRLREVVAPPAGLLAGVPGSGAAAGSGGASAGGAPAGGAGLGLAAGLGAGALHAGSAHAPPAPHYPAATVDAHSVGTGLQPAADTSASSSFGGVPPAASGGSFGGAPAPLSGGSFGGAPAPYNGGSLGGVAPTSLGGSLGGGASDGGGATPPLVGAGLGGSGGGAGGEGDDSELL